MALTLNPRLSIPLSLGGLVRLILQRIRLAPHECTEHSNHELYDLFHNPKPKPQSQNR